jgi:GNAT superfamily N-acetyltransferase
MLVKTLNPAQEPADAAALLPVFRAYYAEAMPGFPAPGLARLRHWAAAPPRSTAEVYGVFPDGSSTEAVGALFTASGLEANLDMVNSSLTVPLAGFDSGTPALLLDELRRLAVAEGRARVITETPSTADSSAALVELSGTKVHTATRSVLDLAEVDREQYAAWAAPSGKNAGYRLVRWIDRCPDELADSYCEAQRAMEDAPLEDLAFEFDQPGLELLRAQEAHSEGFGIRRHVQAAVDAQGRVAGLHIFVTHPDEPETVDVWDTCVIRGHRGRGLGLRLKAAATLWALEQLPEARWVQTFNNHGNAHMLAVNRSLGYRAAEDWYTFEFPAVPAGSGPGAAAAVQASAVLTTSASRCAIASALSCSSASTITRTSGSVPEGRSRTRPP